MSIEQDFYRFCGKLIFEPEKCGWDTLSPEVRKQYCLGAKKTKLERLFVRYLQNRLPEPFYQEFRQLYSQESLKCLIESKELNDLYALLESEKIPFLPIKGADWIFRLYPDQALRPHIDWDIMFHKEDCPQVIALLQERGWSTFTGDAPEKSAEPHHCGMMHNRHQSLEIHWTLPGFGNASEEELWQESRRLTDCHHVLTPEMDLLLLSAHAGLDSYTHLSLWKLLLDAGVLLKYDPVDWEKVHQLADRFEILSPDILLSAWSEFFPAGVLPEESLIPEQQKLIREIFEMRTVTARYSPYERTLAAPEPHDLRWLKKRLRFYNAASICGKYGLSADQKGQIFLCGLRDFFTKLFFFLTHSSEENPELEQYYRKVARLEKLVKRPQKQGKGKRSE